MKRVVIQEAVIYKMCNTKMFDPAGLTSHLGWFDFEFCSPARPEIHSCVNGKNNFAQRLLKPR